MRIRPRDNCVVIVIAQISSLFSGAVADLEQWDIFQMSQPSALVTETLFYEANKALTCCAPLSYYRYRDLCSLAHLICFHDKVVLFRGCGGDPKYRAEYAGFVECLRTAGGMEIAELELGPNGEGIGEREHELFETLLRSVYGGRRMGIELWELVKKTRKDRHAEDFAERLEDIVDSSYPEIATIARRIYEYSQRNAADSELHYFLRAHLVSAMARERGLTVFNSGIRQIAAMLEARLHGSLPTGSCAQLLYEEVDDLLWQRVKNLPKRSTYPYLPLILWCGLTRAKRRSDLKAVLLELRGELADFRSFFLTAGNTIANEDASIADRARKRKELRDMVQHVWRPAIVHLSSGQDAKSRLKRFAKKIVGVGDDNLGDLQITDTLGVGDGSEVSYAISVTSLVMRACKGAVDEAKAMRLVTPNRTLLKLVDEVLAADGVGSKLRKILPVRDFGYRINRVLDREITSRFEDEGGKS